MSERIVALAGGVGGSRFVRGLRSAAPDAALTTIVNTADDITLYGLRISPDVDTMLYALSGTVDEKRGWGPRGDTYRAMKAFADLGGDDWFRLGDVDLGIHMRRKELLDQGCRPSEIVAELARRLDVGRVAVLPMTDDPVETHVLLREGDRWVHFQEYFVRRRGQGPIGAVRFVGVESASPAPGVLEAIGSADVIVVAPSNPIVSIGPILAVPGMRDAVLAARSRGAIVAGVSPLIGGATVKGPADRMLAELSMEPTAAGVASIYKDLLDVFVIDRVDRELSKRIRALGARPVVTNALMRGARGEARLARVLLSAVAKRRAS